MASKKSNGLIFRYRSLGECLTQAGDDFLPLVVADSDAVGRLLRCGRCAGDIHGLALESLRCPVS
jgi:hypothetical protein